MPRRWTPKNKYGSIKTKVGDRVFDSKREAGDAVVLQAREAAGEILHLRYQVHVPIVINETKVCEYWPDFVFFEPGQGIYTPALISLIQKIYDADIEDLDGWRFVCQDSKGWRTQLYALKAKLVKAVYGITILET